MKISEYLKSRSKIVDEALDSYLPRDTDYPKAIHKAMRYSIFSGGKRIRPILVLASCEACGGKVKEALPVACAIEMLHTYSLIHDDLPAMDDDDYRRGKLTCHKKFGEAIGILAGDALLTFAMELLSRGKNSRVNNEVIGTITEAVGTYGMIGGQVVDIEEREETDLPTLTYINAHKTGALIAASCKVGGIAAGASDKKVKALERYGAYIGFTFQVIDDILDKEGFALALGTGGARKEAARLIERAKQELRAFGRKAKALRDLADFLLTRKK